MRKIGVIIFAMRGTAHTSGKTFTGGKRFIPMMSTAITSSRQTGSYLLNTTSLQKMHAII